MPKFKPESDAFRLSEAMRFLCNLLSNLDERIGDDGVAASATAVRGQVRLVEAARRGLVRSPDGTAAVRRQMRLVEIACRRLDRNRARARTPDGRSRSSRTSAIGPSWTARTGSTCSWRSRNSRTDATNGRTSPPRNGSACSSTDRSSQTDATSGRRCRKRKTQSPAGAGTRCGTHSPASSSNTPPTSFTRTNGPASCAAIPTWRPVSPGGMKSARNSGTPCSDRNPSSRTSARGSRKPCEVRRVGGIVNVVKGPGRRAMLNAEC